MTELVTVPGGNRWRVGETEFVYGFRGQSTENRLLIQKTPDLIDRYVAICEEFRHGAIFELGIAGGGSTALISLLAEPRKLVACELNAEPVAGLTSFIEAQGAEAIVRPFYGVDQSDRARLTEIVDAEFDGELLDLVLDDASHEYHPTRASFEVLFPRLRPGGVFVIEDWTTDYTNTKRVVAAMQDRSAPELRRTRASTRRGPGRATPRFGVHAGASTRCRTDADVRRLERCGERDHHRLALDRRPARPGRARHRNLPARRPPVGRMELDFALT